MIISAQRHHIRQQMGTFHGQRAAKRKAPSKSSPRLAMPATGPDDPRPVALSREPCSRCQTRGDLGCPHQQPFAPYRGSAG